MNSFGKGTAVHLTFLGATQTVTGSKYLIEVDNKRILVDCGLFQGNKELRLRNWAPLPINPKSIDAVLLTHAHIDHSGYIPLLVKNGFTGPIYATAGTIALCKILLPDSGHIHEEDAKRANKYGYTKHSPALPLYTRDDALDSLSHFHSVQFGKQYHIFEDFGVSWHRAGHILGSAFVHCESNGVRLLFSGDIGRQEDPIMKPPVCIETTDYLVMESTYGDRLHEKTDPGKILAHHINKTASQGGTIVIPAFAVGRVQDVLYYLAKIKAEGKISDIPIFLDSPMAEDVTDLWHQFKEEHQLSYQECSRACKIAKYVNTTEESKAIDTLKIPKIIISASGMATGGRVLHHLKVFCPDPKNTIIFTGFQATGTRGESMISGKTEVKIHGEMVPIRAKIVHLTELSAHADYQEILAWMKGFKHPPRTTFITHGELEASEGLKKQIEQSLHWNCVIPDYLDRVELI